MLQAPQSELLEVVLALHLRAASRAACTAGNSNAIRMPMIVITTSNSTKVKPDRRDVISWRHRFPQFVRPQRRRSTASKQTTAGGKHEHDGGRLRHGRGAARCDPGRLAVVGQHDRQVVDVHRAAPVNSPWVQVMPVWP